MAGMLKQPPMKALREQVDSRYTLVVAAAKRARQILEGAPPLTQVNSDKPVTISLQELAAQTLRWERTKTGIK